ncbi:hypothetical protein NQ318_020403 [Aromia moschata]|uniref:DDE-1 domain-containing protein n=1 Tax=Aromia moschata TaxID=1265417 RepID=A0AAV8Y268_9CUCU|nr:hypothetical protein NQ318_020403 [Aromia moschata]
MSLRRPEPTSLNRVLAFNRKKFTKNIDLALIAFLMSMRQGLVAFTNHHVFWAQKGRKQVGAITSGERGQNTTIVCSMSASGMYVPLMFIFKRERMKEGLDRNGPVGAIYRCSKSGWITEDLFLEWLRHFAQFVKCSMEDPVLVIMDNHDSLHLKIIYLLSRKRDHCRLTTSPHFSQPSTSAYNIECDLYMKSHHYDKIAVGNIAELFGKAYNGVTTIEKGVKGFKITGIYPLDRNLFGEEEFADVSLESNSTPATTCDISVRDDNLDPIPGTNREPDPVLRTSSSAGVAGPNHDRLTPPIEKRSRVSAYWTKENS